MFNLTSRQLEVIQLVAQGKTNKEIGIELFLSEYTIKNHKQKILVVLGAKNMYEAIAMACHRGLV